MTRTLLHALLALAAFSHGGSVEAQQIPSALVVAKRPDASAAPDFLSEPAETYYQRLYDEYRDRADAFVERVNANACVAIVALTTDRTERVAPGTVLIVDKDAARRSAIAAACVCPMRRWTGFRART